jgi:hypothetical protein
MDKNEARSVLGQHMERWRQRSYQELVALLGHQGCDDVIGPSGTAYQIEVDVCWDGEAGGCVRVMAGIDDGHLLSAFRPLTDDFIMAPDGSFVGEHGPNRRLQATAAEAGFKRRRSA